LSLDSEHGKRIRGLGNLLEELGDDEASQSHQRMGHRYRHVTEIPYRGEGQPVTILLLVSGRKGNVPVRHLLDDCIFGTFAVAPDFYDRDALPPHQLVLNSIGDADLCGAALDSAVNLAERTFAPVINSSTAALGAGRIANARRLAGLPGMVASWTAQSSRHKLADGADLRFCCYRVLRAFTTAATLRPWTPRTRSPRRSKSYPATN
jgi:hypothetical protein